MGLDVLAARYKGRPADNVTGGRER